METVNNVVIKTEEKLFPIIEHASFIAGEKSIEDAVNYHEALIITGPPGSGKTTLLHRALQEYTNSYYMLVSPSIQKKVLLGQIGTCTGYVMGNDSVSRALEEIQIKMYSMKKNMVIMFDEAENLVKKSGNRTNLVLVDFIRILQDYAGSAGVTFIMAGSSDFGKVLGFEESDENTGTKFRRRFQTYPMKAMPSDFISQYLNSIEEEFRVQFAPKAREKLAAHIMTVNRDGLGLAAATIGRIFRIAVPHYSEYYRQLELGIPREDALHVFDGNELQEISADQIDHMMEAVPGGE